MEPATPSEPRLRALVEAGIALASELSLDGLLQRLTELAAELTGARYAALGVIDASGSGLERFVTHGVDDDARAAIGDLPQGRGILGALITDARPLRLHAIADDARSVGFPANHPPMTSFLGVPVLLRGVAYGNLYLTEKDGGGDFTEEDQDLVVLLASQAAVAIENARLYESATRWSRQLESLMEVSSAMAGATSVDRLLELIAERLHNLLEARLLTVALPAGPEQVRIVAAAGEQADGCSASCCRCTSPRRGACSSAGAASASTPSSTTPRSTSRWPGCCGCTRRSGSRSCCATRRSG